MNTSSEDISFLVEPRIMYGDLSNLDNLEKNNSVLIEKKLNSHLQNEVKKSLKKASPELTESIQDPIKNLNYQTIKDENFSNIILKMLDDVSTNQKLKGEVDRLKQKILPSSITVSKKLFLNKPIKNNPIFYDDIQKAKTSEYSRLVNLEKETIDEFNKINLNLDSIGEQTLDKFVEQKIIDEDQKQDIILVQDLDRLTGDNFPFIEILKEEEKITAGKDLVRFTSEDWEKIISERDIVLPPKETPASYANKLDYNVQKTFPSQYLTQHLTKSDLTQKLQISKGLNSLLSNNDKLIDTSKLTSIDFGNKNLEEKEKLQIELKELVRTGNTFKHLDVIEIINDKQISVEEKNKILNTRIEALKRFHNNNSEDLRVTNLLDKKVIENLNWAGIPLEQRPFVIKEDFGLQRVLNLSGDFQAQKKILESGFSAALEIIKVPLTEFQKKTGLPAIQAEVVYEKAQKTTAVITHDFMNIVDVAFGDFNKTHVGNISSSIANDLEPLLGYSELFGSGNYCKCEECRSVTSPAAYFVELMKFVEDNILKQNDFLSSNEAHPLHLMQRRGDLWELPLTCDNIHTLIPYLTIVNEVLSSYLNRYAGNDIFEKMSIKGANLSFFPPFNLPLTEMTIYLKHFGYSLFQIYSLLNENQDKIWRSRLNLSNEELAVISQPNTNAKRRYGIVGAIPSEFLAEDFLQFVGIDRTQLDELLSIQFNDKLKKITIKIENENDDASGLLENPYETILGLEETHLDFIFRFIKIWRKTLWTIPELDLVLISLKNSILGINDLNKSAILNISKLVGIQEKLGLDVEELCAMFHTIPISHSFPNSPEKEEEKMLVEKLFDINELFEGQTEFSFQHSFFNENNPDEVFVDEKTPLVVGGLGISESELLILLQLLQNDLSPNSDGVFTFNLEKLSLLYRHTRLASALELDLEEFSKILELLYDSSNKIIKSIDRIFQVTEFTDWYESSSFSVDELSFIIHGKESDSIQFSFMQDVHQSIADELANSGPENWDTVLSEQFAQHLGSSSEFVKSILILIKQDFLNSGIHEHQEDIDVEALEIFSNKVERIFLLFNNLEFDEEAINHFSEYPKILGINNIDEIRIDAIKELTILNEFLSSLQDEDSENLLFSVLNNYSRNKKFSKEDLATITQIFSLNSIVVESLEVLDFPKNSIESLQYLLECFDFCNTLGINGFTLKKLSKDSSYQNNSQARDIVLGMFTSKYSDDKEEKLEPYQDEINVITRDALTDNIIARPELGFKNRSDLNYYFLLDVERGGCSRTSRVICANSSLQLYIHRCLMNLERSKSDDDGIEPSKIPQDVWEVMKNYRVWQANRLVFSYPENYILPDLRDNKTQIFKGLEDKLLQMDITKESAEQVYKKYLSKLVELAHLKIIGSYDHSETRTYYFFGQTSQDPPRYYYRKWIDESMWTEWEEVDLEIKSDRVSAIINKGKLYLFWLESNIVKSSQSDGSDWYISTQDLFYSFLNEEGTWVPPQKVLREEDELSFWHFEYDSSTTLYSMVFPMLDEDDRILVFHQTHISGTRGGKIDFFSNTIEMISEDDIDNYATIEPETSIVAISRRNAAYTEFQNPVLQEWVLSSTYLEPLLEYFLESKEVYRGEFLTGFFDDSKYKSEMHLVGHGFGDTVFKLGDQQFLIKNKNSPFIKNYKTLEKKNVKLESQVKRTDYDIKGKLDYERFGESRLLEESNLESKTGPNKTAAKVVDDEILKGTVDDGRIDILVQQDDMFAPIFSSNKMYRLTTTLAEKLGEILFNEGLESFLSLETQNILHEDPIDLEFLLPEQLSPPNEDPDKINFEGPYGIYLRELFFHIPFLIANHLNSIQKFEEADWWYKKIFNPTSGESHDSENPTDRSWCYVEFRDLTVEKITDILSDNEAVELYMEDPFNPHAIARLRLSAYQKTIVMKYIDNLLDWGDHKFRFDTRESIQEAFMLYTMASDILGKKPVEVGSCQVDNEDELTYEKIGPKLNQVGEFLIYLENMATIVPELKSIPGTVLKENNILKSKPQYYNLKDNSVFSVTTSAVESDVLNIKNLQPKYELLNYDIIPSIINSESVQVPNNILIEKIKGNLPQVLQTDSLAFCILPNEDFHEYWKRVEDRLFKIRNCMNISGIRRELSLFAPKINPMFLVRAKAAGLSIEEALEILLGQNASPYRFNYIIEKAKQFTQTVQSFGSSLLSASEKKDVEDLTLLRTTHEKNLHVITKQIKEKNIQEAQNNYDSLLESKQNIQNRIDHFSELITNGLLVHERKQQDKQERSIRPTNNEILFNTLAPTAFMIPQVGSPMGDITIGGKQIGPGLQSTAAHYGGKARRFLNESSASGLEATFKRRRQDWNHQLKLAKQELPQVDKQILGAEARLDASESDLELHKKNMEQSDELLEFYENKFSKLGLYDLLSSNLNGIYREAYNSAKELATIAQQSYQFETDDDTFFISEENWDSSRAGLLAGENLLLQLQNMEKAYLENNIRENEITQTFSLAQWSPDALIDLKELGQCQFMIPEFWLNLFYPGQYKRLIKSVRLTIPAVVGPFNNISAVLTLVDSKVRIKTDLENNDDIFIPGLKPNQSSIATSNAQNDGGAFELNFRDERYLPFEGAGLADSIWDLKIPKNLPTFDLRTISDILIHVSYTAKYDEIFRTAVEEDIEKQLSDFTKEHGLSRLISFKHELANSYHQLFNSTEEQNTTKFELDKNIFPYFLKDKILNTSKIELYFLPKGSADLGTIDFTFKVGSKPPLELKNLQSWPDDPNGKILWAEGTLKTDPIAEWEIETKFDDQQKENLDDILILLHYEVK